MDDDDNQKETPLVMAEEHSDTELGKRAEIPGSDYPSQLPIQSSNQGEKTENYNQNNDMGRNQDVDKIDTNKDENGNHDKFQDSQNINITTNDDVKNNLSEDPSLGITSNNGGTEIVNQDGNSSPRPQNVTTGSVVPSSPKNGNSTEEEQIVTSPTSSNVKQGPPDQAISSPTTPQNINNMTSTSLQQQPNSTPSSPSRDIGIIKSSSSPSKHNETEDNKSPIFSPRSPLSGVASDQGESFDSHLSDSDGDNSLIARQLVNEVLDKAIGTVQEGNLENEDITPRQSIEEHGDNQNVFVHRGQGNGVGSSNEDGDNDEHHGDDDEHHGDDDNDDIDGSRISHRVQDGDNDEDLHIKDENIEIVDDNDDDEDANMVVDESTYPDYPLMYGNYKVCRQVAPGVKECLILETGEHIKYDKTRKRSESSTTSSPAKSEATESPAKPDDKPLFKVGVNPDGTSGFPHFDFGNSTDNLSQLVSEGETSDVPSTADQVVNDDLSKSHDDETQQRILSTDKSEKIDGDQEKDEESEEEQLDNDSRIILDDENNKDTVIKKTDELNPVPKTAIHAPSYNIDNYTHIRNDYFGQQNPADFDEGLAAEYENKENIPESRRRRVRISPNGRPPISPSRVSQDYRDYKDRSYTSGLTNERRDGYQPELVASPPGAGPVPGFNTMQEQQVSWLKMFKVLEDQHRKELRSQYAKHTNMIEQMQSTMETELQKQQNNIHRRLEAHRDALTESGHDCQSHLDLYGYYTNDPTNIRPSPRNKHSPKTDRYIPRSPHRDDYHSDSSDIDPLEVRRRMYSSPRNHRVPDDIPCRADISDYSTLPSDSFHVKRSLENEFSTPHSSPDRITEHRRTPRSSHDNSRTDIGGEKLLRGGVYSTPMPMSKGRSSKILDDNRGICDIIHRSPHDSIETLRSSHLRASGDQDYNDESLSYSSRVNLREKHAKHLADLRAYYEQELQELRSVLSSSHSNKETANERMLKEDNQDLRKRCEDLTDELDDSNNHVRELEQRLQGLEIRSADYADRYDDSQRTVLTLKTRLEELHAYAKERDGLLDSLQQKLKHQTTALQEAYKVQDELQETSQRDKQTLQRVLGKYEGLEKEFKLLQESAISKERSLYETRTEMTDLNKALTRLELKNKQLMRENENLHHKAAIAMNMSSVKTSYEDSYSHHDPPVSSYQPSLHHNITTSNSLQNGRIDDSNTLLHSSREYDTSNYKDYKDYSKESLTESENTRISPLIKAEQELRKLQTNQTFSDDSDLKTQKKFFGSDNGYPGCSRDFATGARVDVKAPARTTEHSPRSRLSINKNQATSRVSPKRSNIKTQKEFSPHSRLDVSVKEVKEKKKVVVIEEKKKSSRPSNDNKRTPLAQGIDVSKMNGDTLNTIKKAEVTTTSSTSTTESLPVQALTREERVKDRLQMIQQQEKRYDELTIEKRQLESALNRIPIHGRVDRKSKSDKIDLEKKLEKVEHELGSVRMSLRKYQVLKSSR
ncbi:uncharacterized protein LOC126825238 [Patella vulgata]|uniref:uncharacterized protein LOC126825238 n=1 Tax=Patella vulgata TaxID=6465 RepID=UPI0024A9BE49|nr:uncharacterized protein LOC126825238 [Patella vulgata]